MSVKTLKLWAASGAAVIALAGPAWGQSLFAVDFSQEADFENEDGGFTLVNAVMIDFDNVDDFVDSFEDEELDMTLPEYDSTADVFALFSFRGLGGAAILSDTFVGEGETGASQLTVEFDTLDFASLSADGDFTIDEGGNLVFEGATRDEAVEKFLDFLESSDVTTTILQEAVATTPFDPVAGNPDSLVSTMGRADADLAWAAAGLDDIEPADGTTPTTRMPGEVRISPSVGFFDVGGRDVQTLTVPVSYVRPIGDNRWAVLFDANTKLIDSEGSLSGSLSAGFGVKAPLVYNENVKWRLVPQVRLGVVGSEDLGSAAIVYSGGVTSVASTQFGEVNAALMNSYTVYQSEGIEAGDFDIDYGLESQAFRNGVRFSGDTSFLVFGRTATWEADIANTIYEGDEQFIDNFTEIAVSLGTRRVRNGWEQGALRGGITYIFGNEDYEGFKLNFGYTF